jgi:hypothetical protein
MNLFAINHGLTTLSAFLFSEAVHQHSIHFSRVYGSVRREALCNIACEFGISMKTAALIGTCSNKTCNRFLSCKHLEHVNFLSTLVKLIY